MLFYINSLLKLVEEIVYNIYLCEQIEFWLYFVVIRNIFINMDVNYCFLSEFEIFKILYVNVLVLRLIEFNSWKL